MDKDLVIKSAASAVDGCVAIGYVNIASGELLGVSTVDSHPNEVLALVANATADLFMGHTILEIEETFKRARRTNTSRHYFQEIIVNSDNLIHFFLRQSDNQNQVAVFVCKNKVLLGMALNQARGTMQDLAKAFAA